MSKKTFMRIDWREILALLLIDFLVLILFAEFFVLRFLPPEIDKTYGLLLFFANIWDFHNGDVITLFFTVTVINFALSGVWHFVVKR